MNDPKESDKSFRDSIATVDADGKRVHIHPKKVKGKWMSSRTWVATFLLLFMFSVPWIKIGGQPFLLLDVLGRKFYILGNVFYPQDFYLLVLAMITGVVAVILFTVAYGRLFCGWVCPQTIFMEHVFRRIEYWIEGDRGQQIRLSKLPWSNREKLLKKGGKNVIFWLMSFIIANNFLMILIGSDRWWSEVQAGPTASWTTFSSLVVFTTIFFGVFAWFREQACIIVCPYGRLQGVLLDRNSMVIAYDYKRGETRAKYKKSEDREAVGKGDCIDCGQCVDVCPTGIDIRNGTQLECINCTACIDACDSVMEKIDKPKNLIRYASETSIAEGRQPKITTRTKAYTAVFIILIGLIGYLLSERPSLDPTIVRATGMMYQEVGTDSISNLYNYKIINKRNETLPFEIRVIEPQGGVIKYVGNPHKTIPVGEMAKGAFFVILPKTSLEKSKVDLILEITSGDQKVKDYKTGFTSPRKKH